MTAEIRRFRAICNVAMGERIQFVDASAACDRQSGGVLTSSWRSLPRATIVEHIRPHQEERFAIAAGEAHFTVDGSPRVLRAGETLNVPPGVRHSQHNPGAIAVEGIVELRPALNSRKMHDTFAGLSAEGKTTAQGTPKNPLQLGAPLWHLRRESRVAAPLWIQTAILAPLAAIAKVVGVNAYDDRWDRQL